MLKKLLEGIDKSVLTPQLKNQISEEFKAAVDEKAQEIANEEIAQKEQELKEAEAEQTKKLQEEYEKRLEELDSECEKIKEEYEEKLNKLDAQCEELQDQLKEEAEERVEKIDKLAEEYAEIKEAEYEKKLNELDDKIQSLDKLAEEYAKDVEDEIRETNDIYIKKAVNDFIDECYGQLKSDLEVDKCKAITEAYSTFAKLAGVKVEDIVEARDESSVQAKLDEMTKKYNEAVNDNIQKDAQIEKLQEENDKMLQQGVIAEMAEGLSLYQKSKFLKSAALVEFTADKSYAEKLRTLKEAIADDKVQEQEEKVDEEQEPEDINESVNTKNADQAQRLKRFF
jgi:hypothetical protein